MGNGHKERADWQGPPHMVKANCTGHFDVVGFESPPDRHLA